MKSKAYKLIVFLGNPGKLYAGNRHNAGRLFTEYLPFSAQWQQKFKGLYASVSLPAAQIVRSIEYGMEVAESEPRYGDVPILPQTAQMGAASKIHFLMPETFMNLSGESVEDCASFFKIDCEEILVAHDDLDLNLGQASFKFGGGLGGHNGLRSIKSCLGSADFWRLRIGIGRPGGKKNADDDISSWVLSNFSASETAVLQTVFAACSEALAKSMQKGPESLLPEWNKKTLA
jgi:PTH1 family peptidyl-tRNA hydrolase